MLMFNKEKLEMINHMKVKYLVKIKFYNCLICQLLFVLISSFPKIVSQKNIFNLLLTTRPIKTITRITRIILFSSTLMQTIRWQRVLDYVSIKKFNLFNWSALEAQVVMYDNVLSQEETLPQTKGEHIIQEKIAFNLR